MKIIPVDLTSKFKLECSLLSTLELLSTARQKDLLRSCILVGFDKCKDPSFKLNPEFFAVSEGEVDCKSEKYLIRLQEDSGPESEVISHYSKIYRSRRVEFIRNCILMGFVLSSANNAEFLGKQQESAISDQTAHESMALDKVDKVPQSTEPVRIFGGLLGEQSE